LRLDVVILYELCTKALPGSCYWSYDWMSLSWYRSCNFMSWYWV